MSLINFQSELEQNYSGKKCPFFFDFKYIFKITDKSTNQQKKVLHKGLPTVPSLIVE